MAIALCSLSERRCHSGCSYVGMHTDEAILALSSTRDMYKQHRDGGFEFQLLCAQSLIVSERRRHSGCSCDGMHTEETILASSSHPVTCSSSSRRWSSVC